MLRKTVHAISTFDTAAAVLSTKPLTSTDFEQEMGKHEELALGGVQLGFSEQKACRENNARLDRLK